MRTSLTSAAAGWARPSDRRSVPAARETSFMERFPSVSMSGAGPCSPARATHPTDAIRGQRTASCHERVEAEDDRAGENRAGDREGDLPQEVHRRLLTGERASPGRVAGELPWSSFALEPALRAGVPSPGRTRRVGPPDEIHMH